MAHIAPFRGILYNHNLIEDLSRVLTPPYDVIDEEGQSFYYRLHPYNIIRIDFGKTSPQDTAEDNRYTRAARDLSRWQENNILIQDREPAIYLYTIHFKVPGGEIRVRNGFIALLRLESFESGKVRPHEKTFSSHKRDRYELFQHCRMQFCPIFSFYLDPEGSVIPTLSEKRPNEPFIDFVDQDAVHHQLWRISDPSALKRVMENFSNKTVYIADGHHRYETSLAFQADMLGQFPELVETGSFNYTLMFFCPMEDPGLTIFPVHRILNRSIELTPSTLENKLAEDFIIEKIPYNPDLKSQILAELKSRQKEKGRSSPSFGFFLPQTNLIYLLSLKNKALKGHWVEDLHPLLYGLDVMILSRLIFQKILGIKPEDLDRENMITYCHDGLQTLESVEKSRDRLAFFLNPTPVEQVRRIAEASLVMPRKSTFFYPKTLTGLVMHSLKGDESVSP
ncbi:MAG: DUF1015 domain-containing protein [Thermodesulfobacteriota bacterium]